MKHKCDWCRNGFMHRIDKRTYKCDYCGDLLVVPEEEEDVFEVIVAEAA